MIADSTKHQRQALGASSGTAGRPAVTETASVASSCSAIGHHRATSDSLGFEVKLPRAR